MRESDLLPFAAMNGDPAVMEYFPSPLTREESESMARRIEDHFAEHGHSFWVVEAVGVADFIGVAGLLATGFEAHFTPCIEIAWRFVHAYWGKGYATEAAKALLAFGFEHLGADEIVAFTVPANERSRKVMERLGMSRSPADDFDHPNLPEGHPLRRHVLYRLKRGSWKTVPES
jgi:RimJ/RimL family protein N-acetyltransferase